jgi:hypothetical protein
MSLKPLAAVLLLIAIAISLACAGTAAPRFAQAPATNKPTDVDVELVLAVDISYSMDPDEQALQREGYVLGLTSPEFVTAVKQGMHGRIAVTYVEWAGASDQQTVVPWRIIDGEETAKAVADEIGSAPYRRAFRTSISGALQYATKMLEMSGHHGIRRVIDVSGDGANNQGAPVDLTRDQVLERGITINGLPIMLKRPMQSSVDIENLDVYYEDCVVGGPGSFTIPIREREKFKEATRTKLIQEVAGYAPEVRVINASATAPRMSCLIGERMWQFRFDGRDFR